MADPTPAPSTNPAAKGMATSEGKLTVVAQVIGFLLATFGGLLTKYSAANPQNMWAGIAVTAMGAVMIVVSQYGYVKGRAIVKNALLQGAIDWAAPQLEQLLEQKLGKYLGAPLAPATSSSSSALTAPSSVTVPAPGPR